MITSLDHIVLLCRDHKTVIADYEVLLGTLPVDQNQNSGFNTALFQTGNIGLEIMSPISEAATARTHEILGRNTSMLTSLAFTCDDLEETHRVSARRGLKPADIGNSSRSSFRCNDQVCAGIKTFVLAPDSNDRKLDTTNDLRLDHLVINTPNPDRAIAQYGARLGIRFALDREIAQFHTRFLFFKLGDIVLEIIHKTDVASESTDNDEIWGLTWKVVDLELAHKRLSQRGVTVSEIRSGRKPGTNVFTVKSHSGGIPTLFLSQSA